MYTNYKHRGRQLSAERDVSHIADESAASMYWLGFMFANCVFVGERQIRVNAIYTDRYHLAQLPIYLGFHGTPTPVKKGEQVTHLVALYSSWLYAYLHTIGCVKKVSERKVGASYGVDFWRGYFDGNGALNETMLAVQGNLDILGAWWQFVAPYVRETSEDIHISKHNPYSEFVAEGETMLTIAKVLYWNGTLQQGEQVLAAPHNAKIASRLLGDPIPTIESVVNATLLS